jgi:hypothetical protein
MLRFGAVGHGAIANRRRRGWAAALRLCMPVALFLTVAAATVLVPSRADAAETACTPDTGYTECVMVSYSGSDQTFALPTNAIASQVLVKLWGAGGGGVDYQTMNGGSGGFTTGLLDLSANRSVTVVVGGGGQPACSTASENTGSTVATYGGGGPSAVLPPPVTDAGDWYCGASGGGRSAVRVGSGIANGSVAGEVLTAGGGGGTSDGTGGVDELGGPGGGLVGAAGTCTGSSSCPGGVGGGGTQTAGGPAGQMGSATISYTPIYYNAPANGGYGYIAATAGSQFQGGTSGDGADSAAYETGGGGGGGYFGGGGGGLNSNPDDAPGGGGSGHVDPIVTSGTTTASTTYTPNATNALQYVAGVGVGGGTSTSHLAGGNGLVVFEFNLAPVATAPGAPTAVTVTPGSGQATVAFTPPVNDGGSPITGYTVTATDTTTPTNSVQTASGANSPLTVTGLHAGDTYTFTVTATNAAGTGPSSSPSTATPTSGPAVRVLPATGATVDPTIIGIAISLILGGATICLVARRRPRTLPRLHNGPVIPT